LNGCVIIQILCEPGPPAQIVPIAAPAKRFAAINVSGSNFADAIESIAMDDQEPAALPRLVHGLADHVDAAEMQIGVVAQRLVVVAGHVDDPRPLASLAQHLLDHVVVALVPEPRFLQAPAVDDVAD
jgi:hypothetical protein